MFVVLHIDSRLVQVFTAKMFFEAIQLIRNNGNPVFSNDDAIHLDRPDLSVPVVRSNILDRKPLVGLCLQNFLYKLFVAWSDKPRNQIVAGEDLFVKLISIRIFEWQVAACHCVQDDPG